MDVPKAVIDDIAEALYRIDAPGYAGNEIRPFRELGHWEQKRFERYAQVAIEKWEAARPAVVIANGTQQAPEDRRGA